MCRDERRRQPVAVKLSTEPLRLSTAAPLTDTLAALSESDDMENQLVELQAYRRLGFGARNSSIPKFFESGENSCALWHVNVNGPPSATSISCPQHDCIS